MSDAEWLDQLHRAGMPLDREADGGWLAWLATLKRRHADQAILDVIISVTGTARSVRESSGTWSQ